MSKKYIFAIAAIGAFILPQFESVAMHNKSDCQARCEAAFDQCSAVLNGLVSGVRAQAKEEVISRRNGTSLGDCHKFCTTKH